MTLGYPKFIEPRSIKSCMVCVSKSCTYLCHALNSDGIGNEDPIYSSRKSAKVLSVELVLSII